MPDFLPGQSWKAEKRQHIDALDIDPSARNALPADQEVDAAHAFHSFQPLSENNVSALIRKSAKKSCPLDSMPKSLVVGCLDMLLPVISQIRNLSLSCRHFSDEWKEALVTPILKKPGLDPTQLNNLRPVSNLDFISKLTERAVFDQIHSHMSRFALYPTSQSAYRKGHSTETALLKVQNDILMNMNCKHVTLLVLLDLSAAFDTVDHNILLARLKSSIGINGTALNWFTSYLNNRSQRVSLNGFTSDSFKLPYGVPQGSCLGPLLFTIYSSKLFEVIKYHLPEAHACADDTQLYLSFSRDTATN